MSDRRRFLQTAACLPLLAHPWTANALSTKRPMRVREIWSSGEMLPVMGLGTADTFNVAPSDAAAMAPLAQVLGTLLDSGGTLIDTAPSYGQAEAVTGALLARAPDPRPRVFLATKIGTEGHESAMRQIQNSQRALKSDKLDLIQVHNLIDTRNQLALLRELKQQGLTRYIGITHYTDYAHDELTDLVEREKPDFLQVNLSVGARNAEKRLLPACLANGVAVLINRPFQDGALFRGVKGRALPDLAAEIGCGSWAQLFLKFIISHPAVTAVIPATSKPANMADNILAGFGPLPNPAQRERIAALLD
ncbi:aldo/keto reductase [Achromobacter sp. UMC71]|uniref:aldo/keto reductase n=1 Tax=Achromobacter sp. UMC71 TaxID=1862320 RepID=UPI00160415AE|nr:aldo/keto reductase [Achromobacter sp. UMC71]MBB1629022.1 aldo/keto reductase [Achromobacter sp. UMC71]